MPAALNRRIKCAPVLMRTAAAEKRLTEWLDSLDDPPARTALAAMSHRPLLLAVADYSPFLWRLIEADPQRCVRLLTAAPESSLSEVLSRLRDDPVDDPETAEAVMRRLRLTKQEIALLVAMADLGEVWTVEQVTDALTAFADAAVRCAIGFLLRDSLRSGKLKAAAAPDLAELGHRGSTGGPTWAAAGQFTPPEASQAAKAAAPESGCGLVVLALGKQGGGELNYSSDIDLVVLFDPKAPRLADSTVPSQFYVRLTQTFVRLMQERTPDGYVLRVDLRLRPDPASTAVAIGLPSAFSYYESYGQNWERAAFIKARSVAGDLSLGERFLSDLAPFIWRKYFDFAAIADIHAMKRQIHAVRGQSEIAVEGHNVKLGRGGIREIEFFVQTQQLIFGGRRPELRGRGTLAMLQALAADGWIDAAAVTDLSAAYRFLRTVEHRLQMVADEQTQRLPATEAETESFARFAGFADRASFAAVLTGHLRRVEAHYARLFEHAPGLDTETGSLVFTGTAVDPDTIETLGMMGFIRPADAAEIIRGWHFGRRAAVQSPRAREVLTELVPALLNAFSGSADPDAALASLDTMLGRMPAAIELFSLLRSNRDLRNLFADIVGSAPRLGATIVARPHLLDAAIDPATVGGAGGRADPTSRVEAALGQARSTEDFLDKARDLAQEELFLIGVRLLSGTDEPHQTGEALSRLADLVVRAALDRCRADFAAEHGTMPGGACVVLAMGKLGSREMTVTSDLDLIVIYRFNSTAGDSTGDRPLDGARYYARLTQRLIAALTAPTRRGRLYDVDVRLRPSGRQGPLATRFSAFVSYQDYDAQTWEHMALTRARVVAGDADLAADVEAAIRATLLRPRDPDMLRAEVRSMRALIAREKGEGAFWDMKLAAGGLLDLEFIAQYLVLRHGHEHPDLLQPMPSEIISTAARIGLIEAEDAAVLLEAHRLQTAVAQLTCLTIEGRFDPAKAGTGVLRRLTAACQEPDISALQSALTDLRNGVRAFLRQLLNWPA